MNKLIPDLTEIVEDIDTSTYKGDINPLTTRKCRKCNNFLPASRYFKHIECLPSVEFHDLDLDYQEIR